MPNGIIGMKELAEAKSMLFGEDDMSKKADAERQRILFEAEKSLRIYSEKEIKNALMSIFLNPSVPAAVLRILRDCHFSIEDIYTEESVLKFAESLGITVTDEVKNRLRNFKNEVK